MKHKVLMVVKMLVLIFWILMPYGLASRYHHFRGTATLKMEVMFLQNVCVLLTRPHSITTHKTNMDIIN
jgi:hypothetical protein